MTPNEFRPAQSLDEANDRLRAAEQALNKARRRLRRSVYMASPAEQEAMRKKMEATTWIDGFELLARLKAEVAEHDDQH